MLTEGHRRCNFPNDKGKTTQRKKVRSARQEMISSIPRSAPLWRPHAAARYFSNVHRAYSRLSFTLASGIHIAFSLVSQYGSNFSVQLSDVRMRGLESAHRNNRVPIAKADPYGPLKYFMGRRISLHWKIPRDASPNACDRFWSGTAHTVAVSARVNGNNWVTNILPIPKQPVGTTENYGTKANTRFRISLTISCFLFQCCGCDASLLIILITVVEFHDGN